MALTLTDALMHIVSLLPVREENTVREIVTILEASRNGLDELATKIDQTNCADTVEMVERPAPAFDSSKTVTNVDTPLATNSLKDI